MIHDHLFLAEQHNGNTTAIVVKCYRVYHGLNRIRKFAAAANYDGVYSEGSQLSIYAREIRKEGSKVDMWFQRYAKAAIASQEHKKTQAQLAARRLYDIHMQSANQYAAKIAISTVNHIIPDYFAHIPVSQECVGIRAFTMTNNQHHFCVSIQIDVAIC